MEAHTKAAQASETTLQAKGGSLQAQKENICEKDCNCFFQSPLLDTPIWRSEVPTDFVSDTLESEEQ